MAGRVILQTGNPGLKAKNMEVVDFKDAKVKQVVDDLVDTMRENELVGVAAPQIGENMRIFITEPRQTETRGLDQADELRVYVNPAIVEASKEESVIYEGCGSFARGVIFGPVNRPRELVIEAFDVEGKKFRLRCDGLLARVIWHEFDHLQGIEFIEKVTDLKKLIDKDVYIKEIRLSKEQEKVSIITKKEVEMID